MLLIRQHVADAAGEFPGFELTVDPDSAVRALIAVPVIRLVALKLGVEKVRPGNLHVNDEGFEATVVTRPVVQVDCKKSFLFAPLEHVPPLRMRHVGERTYL